MVRSVTSARKGSTITRSAKGATATPLALWPHSVAVAACPSENYVSAKNALWAVSATSAGRSTGTSSLVTHKDVKNASAMFLERSVA